MEIPHTQSHETPEALFQAFWEFCKRHSKRVDGEPCDGLPKFITDDITTFVRCAAAMGVYDSNKPQPECFDVASMIAMKDGNAPMARPVNVQSYVKSHGLISKDASPSTPDLTIRAFMHAFKGNVLLKAIREANAA